MGAGGGSIDVGTGAGGPLAGANEEGGIDGAALGGAGRLLMLAGGLDPGSGGGALGRALARAAALDGGMLAGDSLFGASLGGAKC